MFSLNHPLRKDLLLCASCLLCKWWSCLSECLSGQRGLTLWSTYNPAAGYHRHSVCIYSLRSSRAVFWQRIITVLALHARIQSGTGQILLYDKFRTFDLFSSDPVGQGKTKTKITKCYKEFVHLTLFLFHMVDLGKQRQRQIYLFNLLFSHLVDLGNAKLHSSGCVDGVADY